MEEQIVIHKTSDNLKVKLIKWQKDTYAWEITVQGDNTDSILKEAQEINTKLRLEYKDQLGA